MYDNQEHDIVKHKSPEIAEAGRPAPWADCHQVLTNPSREELVFISLMMMTMIVMMVMMMVMMTMIVMKGGPG